MSSNQIQTKNKITNLAQVNIFYVPSIPLFLFPYTDYTIDYRVLNESFNIWLDKQTNISLELMIQNFDIMCIFTAEIVVHMWLGLSSNQKMLIIT